ncbi:class I SAM-dependent methyltransferase [Actinoplanes sp. CA-015351]|uniref:class I SAM-dependent methyltransferase n=1 Tax=Actinoplanes sp. CA-015351 TaxID=3239897 RepID=UPI003D96CA95
MTTLVWDLYARCYDVIAGLSPYRKMVFDLMDLVPERPRRVLDAGCGTGNLTLALSSKSPGEAVAVDLSPVMLEVSRRKNPDVAHLRADLDGDLAELPGEFDVILCGNVIYALADPARTVELLKKRLVPGGLLLVTTPRAGAGVFPILAEHIRERGIVSLWRVILPLLVVGVINARLLTASAHHFLTRDQLREVLGTDRIRTTYSGQAWLAVYQDS